MEGVVVEVRVRAPCKQFAIKDNGICDRSARGFDGRQGKASQLFFPENNTGGDRHERQLKHEFLLDCRIDEWQVPTLMVVSAIAIYRRTQHPPVLRSTPDPNCGTSDSSVRSRRNAVWGGSRMPWGTVRFGSAYSVILPSVVIRPIRLPISSVNHSAPSGRVCDSAGDSLPTYIGKLKGNCSIKRNPPNLETREFCEPKCTIWTSLLSPGCPVTERVFDNISPRGDAADFGLVIPDSPFGKPHGPVWAGGNALRGTAFGRQLVFGDHAGDCDAPYLSPHVCKGSVGARPCASANRHRSGRGEFDYQSVGGDPPDLARATIRDSAFGIPERRVRAHRNVVEADPWLPVGRGSSVISPCRRNPSYSVVSGDLRAPSWASHDCTRYAVAWETYIQ